MAPTRKLRIFPNRSNDLNTRPNGTRTSDPHRARRSPGRGRLGSYLVVAVCRGLVWYLFCCAEFVTILNPSFWAAHSAGSRWENPGPNPRHSTKWFLRWKNSTCPSLGCPSLGCGDLILGQNLSRICPSLGWAANGHPILGHLS